MAYKHYTDDEQAVALAYLRAAGYPDKPGALKDAARHTGVSGKQLVRWYRGESTPPPDNLVSEKVFDLQTAINEELQKIFDAMGAVREDASYKDLATAAGIFADKAQLLAGKPTAINEERVSDARDRLAQQLDRLAAVSEAAEPTQYTN